MASRNNSTSSTLLLKKLKAVLNSIQMLGLQPILVYSKSARRWHSHKPSSRVHAIAFHQASQLTHTKSYCLMTESNRCKQLVRNNYIKCNQPEFLVDRANFHVVQRQEGLRLNTLLLHVLDALLGRLLRVACDGVHVLAQHLGDSHLVLLVTWLTEINQSTILQHTTSDTLVSE